MSKYFKISLILKLTNSKEPILDNKVYITYYPSDLLFDGTTFPVTTCLPYRLLGNTIQQEPDQHISPPIVEITPTEGEKGGEEGEGKEREGERKKKGEEGGTEKEKKEEREKREEEEKQFELKEKWEEE